MIVYKLTNKINGREYVGKTIGTLDNRWKEHVYESKTGGARLLCKAIRKYGEENFIKVVIDTAVSEIELAKKEKEWISKLNTVCFGGGIGYNMTEGGEGSSGFKQSEESKKKISETKSEKVIDIKTGRIFASTKELALFYKISPEYANKLLCGRANSKEGYVFRHLDSDKRQKADNENKNVQKSRSIPQPILCVETGKEYPSIKEASKILGISRTNIGNMLAGRAFSAGGFSFIYLDDKNNKNKNRLTKRKNKRIGKAIVCLTTGEKFNSIQHASVELNRSPKTISNHLGGFKKTCAGRILNYSISHEVTI